MDRPEVTLTILFCIATAVAIAVRRLKIPYTVALVLAGLGLGALTALPTIRLTKELLYAVFLPGLIFEASFHMPVDAFRQNKGAIAALAVPGVLVGIAVTALMMMPFAGRLSLLSDFTFRDALILGALLAATDPIAVVALFKSLGAPKRLGVLIEGESLLNDGTAVVAYTLLLGALAGGSFSLTASAVEFVKIVGMGLLIGGAVGLLISKLIQAIDDPMIEITLTTIAAYGSFIVAEAFHFSGVIATVVAGMFCGNYAARTGMSPTTRVAVQAFWEYVAFALNSLVFLLIGLEVRLSTVLHSMGPILAAYAAVVAARGVVVALSMAGLSFTRERVPWRWGAVLTWGGLRGGLSMVLVLALPADFTHREVLVTLTFGVVVLSILVQGLTMGPLLRRLGLSVSHASSEEYELRSAQLKAVRGGQRALEALASKAPPDIVGQLRGEYEGREAELVRSIADLHLAQDDLRREHELRARRQVLMAEKDALQEAVHHGEVGRDAGYLLLAELDARLLELDEHP